MVLLYSHVYKSSSWVKPRLNWNTKKFNIISKLSSKQILNKGNLKYHLINKIKEFNIEQIHGYMIHDFKKFVQHDYLLKELESIKKEGLINIIGISLYENDE